MSASPLVVRPADALKPAGAVGSPFRNVSSAQVSSGNGTPQPSKDKKAAPVPTTAPTLDLAEQMNEVEKKQYVKGS